MEKVKCGHCGKERPITEMEKWKILFRDRKPNGRAFINSRYDFFCKDKPCAAHEQMACEG